MTGKRRPQPADELKRVARARRRVEQTAGRHDAARLELEQAIREASAAGATLRPIAEAAGLSIERTRQLASRT